MKYMEWDCPECGASLEVYAEYPITPTLKDKYSCPTMKIELIRHCKNCLSDWVNIYSERKETQLERKFWG